MLTSFYLKHYIMTRTILAKRGVTLKLQIRYIFCDITFFEFTSTWLYHFCRDRQWHSYNVFQEAKSSTCLQYKPMEINLPPFLRFERPPNWFGPSFAINREAEVRNLWYYFSSKNEGVNYEKAYLILSISYYVNQFISVN